MQILFPHFMNMNYLITLCFARFMQINYWQIRTLRRAPRNFSGRPAGRCILAGNEFGKEEMVDLQMLGRRRNTCSVEPRRIGEQRSLAPLWRCYCALFSSFFRARATLTHQSVQWKVAEQVVGESATSIRGASTEH